MSDVSLDKGENKSESNSNSVDGYLVRESLKGVKKGRGRKVEFEKGRRKKFLQERDSDVLQFCFDQYFLVKEQVMSFLKKRGNFKEGDSLRVVSWKVLEYLERHDLIEKKQSVLLNSSVLYNVTKEGVKVLKCYGKAPDFGQYMDLDTIKLRHDFIATNIRLVMEEAITGLTWTTERTLREDAEENVPDAEFWFYSAGAGRKVRVAVEVEITQKSRSRYQQKFRDYEKSRYDMVVYFVMDDATKKVILAESKGVSEKIYVSMIEDVLTKKGDALCFDNETDFSISSGFGLIQSK